MSKNLNSVNWVCFNLFYGKFILLIFLICIFSLVTFTQSSDQNLPTPITENQINGKIKARDIGDSRLTSYYFIFNGNRGDIFINVVTSNLNGDIDIFTIDGLKPKTKITLYADNSENETGRVIYLRKAEKLILRIQGRTPNDDSATFQIKFAGSFAPIQGVAKNKIKDLPKVLATSDAKVKVNSVGTIIEGTKLEDFKDERPTTITVEGDRVATTLGNKDENNSDNNAEESKVNDQNKDTYVEPIDKDKKVKDEKQSTFDPTKKVDDILKETIKDQKPKVVISDPFNDKENKGVNKISTPDANNTKENEVTLDLKDKPKNTSAIVRIELVEEPEVDNKKVKAKSNPLAKVFLKIQLKNGEKFERSMVEIVSMNVIKGVLTIVTDDGKIIEHSILDVSKMTIE